MKKIISFIMFFALVMFANAEEATFDVDANDVVYIEGTVQTGVGGNLSIMLKNSSKKVGTITYCFSMPEGVEMNVNEEGDVVDIESEGSVTCHQQADGSFKLAINYGKTWAKSSIAREIASIPVNCTATAGTYEITATAAQVIFEDATGVDFADFYTEVTVLNTAVIKPFDEGYGLEIIPFQLVGTNNYVASIYMKNATAVDKLSFDIVTSAKIRRGKPAPTDAVEGENVTINTTNSGEVTSLVFTDDWDEISIAKSTDYRQIATITLKANGIENTLCDLKITNVKMGSGSKTYSGEYMASVFVGTPTETAPTLYGHYTKDIISTLNDGVAKNFCTVDMSAATVDEGCKVNDALVYTGDNTTYDRSITTTYGTVCLPIEATGTFYTLSAATADKLTFTPLEGKLPANTPAIFSGAISAAAEGTVTPGTPGTGATANGLTLTGTYKTFELADGAGYFISKDKFYNDGATVKAFRSYFTGTISSGAKALRIEIEDANGVRDITDQLSDQDIFNLQGIRVQTAKKGVNIINGKKVYVK